MVYRLAKLSNTNSFFLFGPRGTGKTTLINEFVKTNNLKLGKVLWIDLLTEADEDKYGLHPDHLSHTLETDKYSLVVIDEVQKFPKLLDIVHLEIEKRKIKFILTGSSARKLKKGGANLLAGRAFSYHLYPLTFHELKDHFNLLETLQYGSLPKLLDYSSSEDKSAYLRTYVKTYLKEEIVAEQIIRNIEPFRDFLEISAQTNGEIINYSKISKDLRVDDKTVKNYFSILEETLVGFYLKPFHRSIRKRQRENPKFYLFDTGVKRALELKLTLALQIGSSEYGKAFEHFILCEVNRLNEYYQKDFRLSYLKTKDDAEIDLIIERPGAPDLLIEIKSTKETSELDCKVVANFLRDWDKKCEAEVWSNDSHTKKINGVTYLHWMDALNKLFNI